MPSIEFSTPLALWGLLLALPIIILYLLRPKPKHIRFPSVMFIINAEKAKRLRSFFKKIVRDPLLLLQILLIALMVCGIAGPFFLSLEEENLKETAVVVMDSSASMQATDVSPDRFGRARAVARDIIGRMNDESIVSIVLAENSPIILGRNMKKEPSLSVLPDSFVSDSPSNIGDAVLFAKEMFSGEDTNKKIYVLSDYAHPEGSDLRLVQKIASQSNVSVSFVRVNGDGKNIALVDAKVKRFITDRNRFYTTYTVHNFFEGEKDVEAQVLVDDKVVSTQSRKIAGNSEKLYTYEGNISEASHRIVIKLSGEDSLNADNTAYMYMPEVKKYRVLLISEENADQYIRYALSSSKDIELRIAIPPVIPEFDYFDVVIMGELKKEFILPGTFRDLHLYANKGGHVIFIASENLPSFKNNKDLADFLPVTLDSVRNKTGKIDVLTDHEILLDVVPKGSSEFPNIAVSRYITCTAKNASMVIAEVMNSPVISYNLSGRGKVVYIGINPASSWSNFYYSSSFPVFWLQLISWVNRDDSTLGVNNFHTGDYLPVSLDTETQTPSGKIVNSGNILLDESGFYEIYRAEKTDVIGVSLLSEKESDISASPMISAVDDKDLNLQRESVNVKREILPYLITASIIFFLMELYYYKRRGML
ncbi:MAG: VWA domain-containing protein [Candidatus Altiarchaeia archaeon]